MSKGLREGDEYCTVSWAWQERGIVVPVNETTYVPERLMYKRERGLQTIVGMMHDVFPDVNSGC